MNAAPDVASRTNRVMLSPRPKETAAVVGGSKAEMMDEEIRRNRGRQKTLQQPRLRTPLLLKPELRLKL
jgi:hypothetical protein